MSNTSRSAKRDVLQQHLDEREVREALLGEVSEDFAGELGDGSAPAV
ncbi:hypothetical protein [Curtobacterium sp. Leaf261]|nr:hypothetical protein [Curtobacterium sp. Leaf261]